VTFSGGIRNLIVFGDISFKIQCTRLVLIGYKNVTGDIQKYVKIIMKNGFCNVKFCFGIAVKNMLLDSVLINFICNCVLCMHKFAFMYDYVYMSVF
jgi:hypothetical protein